MEDLEPMFKRLKLELTSRENMTIRKRKRGTKKTEEWEAQPAIVDTNEGPDTSG